MNGTSRGRLHQLIRQPLALLLILLLGWPQGHAAGERLPVWQLAGPRAQMTLLGSVHLAYPGLYPLREEIESAFMAADTLVVEVDIRAEQRAQIQRLFLAAGTLPPGETLRGQLSDTTWRLLGDYLQGRGLPLAAFTELRPGLVATTLSTLALAEQGLDPELGIDLHFLQRAGEGRAVIELESAEQQAALMLDFPEPDVLLRQTLVELDAIDEYLEPLYQAWLAGDEDALEQRLLLDERERYPEFEPVYRRLYDERNLAMAARIIELLNTEGRVFVVVGAGHLVGRQGIIALLRAAGFDPQRL